MTQDLKEWSVLERKSQAFGLQNFTNRQRPTTPAKIKLLKESLLVVPNIANTSATQEDTYTQVWPIKKWEWNCWAVPTLLNHNFSFSFNLVLLLCFEPRKMDVSSDHTWDLRLWYRYVKRAATDVKPEPKAIQRPFVVPPLLLPLLKCRRLEEILVYRHFIEPTEGFPA